MNINEIQKAVYQNKVNKGFNITDVNKEFCLLCGEVAEAYDSWRKNKGDVAIYLLGLSEILEINLEDEIQKKLTINQKRQYVEKDGVLLKVENR